MSHSSTKPLKGFGFVALLGLCSVALYASQCSAKETLSWERSFPGNAHEFAFSKGFTRVFVRDFGGRQKIEAFGLDGKPLWSHESDTCFLLADDVIWAASGTNGMLLDPATGAILKKSPKIRGVARDSHCGAISGDGRYLLSGYTKYGDESESTISAGTAMMIDLKHETVLWHDKPDAPRDGKMPADGHFIINDAGVFSLEGDVVWAFPYRPYDLPLWLSTKPATALSARYQSRTMGRPGWHRRIYALAENGGCFLSKDIPIDPYSQNKSGRSYIEILNEGDPAKKWIEVELSSEAVNAGSAISQDGQYFAVVPKYPLSKRDRLIERSEMSLYRTDGTLLWSKSISLDSIPAGLGPLRDARARFDGDKLLIRYWRFTDVYTLDGRLLKRIPHHVDQWTPAEERASVGPWFLDDHKYANVGIERYRDKKTDKIEVWVGDINEPD